jgi:hypothetical protein
MKYLWFTLLHVTWHRREGRWTPVSVYALLKNMFFLVIRQCGRDRVQSDIQYKTIWRKIHNLWGNAQSFTYKSRICSAQKTLWQFFSKFSLLCLLLIVSDEWSCLSKGYSPKNTVEQKDREIKLLIYLLDESAA